MRNTSAFSPVRRQLWPQDLNIVRFVKATEAPTTKPGAILILDLDLPQPTRSGGHRRLLEIAEIMAGAGLKVTIGTCNSLERTSVAWGVPISALRAEAEVLRRRFSILAGPREISEFLNRDASELAAVWFSRTGPGLLYLHLVLAAAPRARVIFDSMDAEHVRLARRSALNDLDQNPGELLDVLRRERTMVQAADAVIAVTESDAAALAELADGSSEVVVIPNLYNVDARTQHGTHDEDRYQWDLLFVGGFLHEPNTDAVRWLLDGIVPLLPENRFRLALVGHGLPPHLVRQAETLGVHYLGEVRSLDEVYAATRVSIAPVRFGSGVKGKVIEAALHGLPVIGTTVAWEGIEVRHGTSGVIADGEAEFVAAIEDLVKDSESRAHMVEQSAEWLSRFSASSYAGLLRQIVGTDT
jgi:glycosyltransferase involved in cell wall biosynthesis